MEFLGTRVVRGPDWNWKNQDGGEGNVGTVVQIGRDKKSPVTAQIVWVQWDSGNKANYRAGVDGKHDLRVLDSGNGDVRHLHVLCDGCNQEPIIGHRWHCLVCSNFDLCTRCYMTDIHDVEHRFERIDWCRGKGIEVGKRQGSIKLDARGIFKGAKVVRGPDWEWKDQDGGQNKEGEVKEIVGWKDETTKDAVRVSWKEGQRANIYRLGKDGKVDLKCTVPAKGTSYYRDHLPQLALELKKSQSGFTTGDKVTVQLASEKLQELSAGHGEWNADMAKFIGKVGVVVDFASNGDVLVEYPEKLWRYNPAALTKIQNFKRGDEVIIQSDKNVLKELQEGHGGWNDAMVSILGRTGKVLEVDGTGDLLVLVEGDKWMLNPAAATYVTDPEPVDSPTVDSEDPLGFFHLFRDFLLSHAREQTNQLLLVAASRNNNLSRVKEILDNHPEMLDQMEGGHSALHVACHEGHCDVIRELIDRGADRDKQDTQGYTAIHHSTYGDKTGEALKLLLELGFDPNVQHNDNGSTPLHLAVKNDNEMAVRILTQHVDCDINVQDDAGDTSLYYAIAAERHSMVAMLMDHPRLSITVTNQRGFNYLQFAVLKGNTRAVEKLLAKAGSVLNVPKSDGFTPLHIAAINDHREIAKLLLKQPGCDVNAPSQVNQSPLHLAADEGYSVMAEILLDHGANVNALDDDRDTPLHITLAKESIFKTNLVAQLPALHMLLRGVDRRDYAGVSRVLLNYGADVLQRNNSGQTPLDRCSDTEVEQLVREIAASKGTSRVMKVPTFGGTIHSEVQTYPSNEINPVPPETTINESLENPNAVGETIEETSNVTQRGQNTQTSNDEAVTPLEPLNSLSNLVPMGTTENEAVEDRNAVDETNEEGSGLSQQAQDVQLPTDEAVNQSPREEHHEEGEETEEDASMDNNLADNSMQQIQENVVLEITNQVQEGLPTAEVSNDRVKRVASLMNNGNAENDEMDALGSNNTNPPKKSQETNEQEAEKAQTGTENMDVDEDTEDKEEKPKCRICEENVPDVAFKPCGHIVICAECAPRIKRCLECQSKITGKARKDGTPITAINNKSLAVKYQLLEAKTRKLEESIVCYICVERKKNVIFLCGHGTCQSCAQQLKACPICQKEIERKIPIF